MTKLATAFLDRIPQSLGLYWYRVESRTRSKPVSILSNPCQIIRSYSELQSILEFSLEINVQGILRKDHRLIQFTNIAITVSMCLQWYSENSLKLSSLSLLFPIKWRGTLKCVIHLTLKIFPRHNKKYIRYNYYKGTEFLPHTQIFQSTYLCNLMWGKPLIFQNYTYDPSRIYSLK